MAANYGMRRRDLHALYPALWAAADEETREKAVKRYEQRLKSRDKQKTDVLSREAWIACKIIVDGWRRHNPASVDALLKALSHLFTSTAETRRRSPWPRQARHLPGRLSGWR